MTDEEPEADPDVAAIEGAMVRIRRSQRRRTIGRRAADEGSRPVDLALVEVVDAVEQGPSEGARGVSVGDVAERLGVDPSRGSRLVARAVAAGHLARVASRGDARRSELELTESGHRLAEGAHRLRRRVFAEAMADWPERDRREFARLLARFTDALAEGTRASRHDKQPRDGAPPARGGS